MSIFRLKIEESKMKKFLACALTLAMLLSFGVIAFADDRFDWEACEGTTIQVAVVEHNVSSCIEAKIDQFTEKTGIMVELIRIPEAYYFDKLYLNTGFLRELI